MSDFLGFLSAARTVSVLSGRIAEARRRRSQMRTIESLPDNILSDIGLGRRSDFNGFTR
jgi:hypothetical protein